jgi:acetyl esterase/lipase
LVNRKIQGNSVDTRIYKVINGRELRLHIFYPAEYSASNKKRYPAAASIHGGGWTQGPLEWGDGDAAFMATLGFVGIAVEYRLADHVGVSALDCMKDVNSAVRWIRLYAKELNIDPKRVLTIGHSAGGHMSLSTVMFPDVIENGEDKKISSVPNAVVAMSPAVELTMDSYFQKLLLENVKAKNYSPMGNIRKLDISILIIQGTADEILPVAYTEEFVKKMKMAGNDIELKIFPDGRHNFLYESDEGARFYK